MFLANGSILNVTQHENTIPFVEGVNGILSSKRHQNAIKAPRKRNIPSRHHLNPIKTPLKCHFL